MTAAGGPARALGRRKARRDPRVPRVEAYLDIAQAAADGTIGWAQEVASWPMCLNDRIGSCTIAGVAHAAQLVGVIGGAERVMTDAEVLTNYRRFGYVPALPATDHGAVEEDVLQVWLSEGLLIGGVRDRIDAFASITPTSPDAVRAALRAFGIVYIGADLPLAAQAQVIWDVGARPTAADAPGSWGGHCMLLVAAEPCDHPDNLVTFVTWGTTQQATWRWWLRYCAEAHAVDHPDWSRSGSLLGCDRAALRAAIAQLQDATFC